MGSLRLLGYIELASIPPPPPPYPNLPPKLLISMKFENRNLPRDIVIITVTLEGLS